MLVLIHVAVQEAPLLVAVASALVLADLRQAEHRRNQQVAEARFYRRVRGIEARRRRLRR